MEEKSSGRVRGTGTQTNLLSSTVGPLQAGEHESKARLWGAWKARSVKHLTSAQVVISQLVGSSPASGSVLTARSLEPASDFVSPSLSAPPSLMLSLSKISTQKKNVRARPVTTVVYFSPPTFSRTGGDLDLIRNVVSTDVYGEAERGAESVCEGVIIICWSRNLISAKI